MLAQAEKECQALLKEAILPGDQLELIYLLSGVYSHAGQQAKAEEQLERCLKLDPTNATFNNDLGYLWADQNKRLPEAEVLIRRAIDQDRLLKKTPVPFAVTTPTEIQDNAAYIDSLGWVLFRRGQFKEARRTGTGYPVAGQRRSGNLGPSGRRLPPIAVGNAAREAWEKALHFYAPDKGRKIDERYRELQKKLKTPETLIQSR